MSSPSVIIVIPVYNGAQTIEQTINSVINQTYTDWQLIIHDNCSTDGTRERIRAIEDNRISLVEHTEFLSMCGSWNRCMKNIETEFFQLLCADDYLHPEYLEEKMKWAIQPEYNEVVLFSSDRMLVSKNGKPIFSIGFGKEQGVYTVEQVMQKSYIKNNPIGDPSTGLVRTSALTAQPVSGHYPFFSDVELWLHVLEKGKMLHIPKALSSHRLSGFSLTSSRFWKNFGDTIRFYRERIKPFYADQLFKYYLGYIYFTYRTFARQLLFMLNR